MQWAWGLDGNHDRGAAAPDQAMQQATVNLLADMGAQPGYAADPDLIAAASASTDTFAPDVGHHVAGQRRARSAAAIA